MHHKHEMGLLDSKPNVILRKYLKIDQHFPLDYT